MIRSSGCELLAISSLLSVEVPEGLIFPGGLCLIIRNMNWRLFITISIAALLLVILGTSCTPSADGPISLASFTENNVRVSIYLHRNPHGGSYVAATFTPPHGYHLYSKDIPITGVDGLGRPTLLELTSNSRMTALGYLNVNVKPQEPVFESGGLPVYPPGAVTLSLPVELPPGKDWVDDEISVTYMTCGNGQCKPPVNGKIVAIRVPGADLFSSP
jgi:hypothetical protein